MQKDLVIVERSPSNPGIEVPRTFVETSRRKRPPIGGMR